MKKKYLYRDYITTLSERFTNKVSEITANHNFEYGDEFEIAICEILERVLPTKFGVARGYAVNKESESAGDDIIIYERVRFPTLQPRDKQNFAHKEYIPIEAIYCYIEAKHTIILEGDGKQSLQYALSQVRSVKNLIAQRKPVGLAFISPSLDLSESLLLSRSENVPNIQNPFFSMVWARNVKFKKAGAIVEDHNAIKEKLLPMLEKQELSVADMMVLGPHNIVTPFIPLDSTGNRVWASPFFMSEKSQYGCMETPQTAFGLGMATLMYAIDSIQLGIMPWGEIIGDAFGFKSLNGSS